MRFWAWLLIAFIWAGHPQATLAQEEAYPDSVEEALRQIQELPWEHGQPHYALTRSHSSLGLPDNYYLLRNQAAQRFIFLNHGLRQPNTEAVLFDPDTNNQVIFSYHETGYISTNTWKTLDAEEILKRITRLTEKENLIRKQHQMPVAKVLGWIQEPTLDRDNQSIHWVFSFMEGGQKMVNAVMVKLGRQGFERIIWVTPYAAFQKSDGLIRDVIAQHRFDNSYRYADRQLTDRLAGFDIIALVQALSGGPE